MLRELIASPFRSLAAIPAASAFGWDAWKVPDDDELLDSR
jgi:hypothetical protein